MKKRKKNITSHKKTLKKQKRSKVVKNKKIQKKLNVAPTPVEVVKISSENAPIKKTRRKKTPNVTKMYFTQDTEDAIIQYNTTENQEEREKIFVDRILQPFQKLVENIFNTFKFSYFKSGPQDAQKECLTHLVANIHKFDPNRKSKINPEKKAKAFAYFSIIAKHYLILLNNTNHKEFNTNVEISEERDENTIQLQQNDKYYAQQEMNDFIKLVIEFWEKNAEKIFTKKRDLNIANAVVELFRNSERIDSYNKKALYLYIREMAMCKTQQITKVINRMKQYQNTIQKTYLEHGYVNTDRY